jgi:hypothetical protein
VQRTNKRDVEKILLRLESFRRTSRLLIEGVFAEEEPDLSAKILATYYRCPLVFQNYLQPAERIPDELDDLDETGALELSGYPTSQLVG